MTIDEEVRRATKLLETIMQAEGLTRKDLDQRLGAGPGYMSQLFTGRMELKLRHVLSVLRALEVEPGLFFQTLYPAGPPVADKLLLEEFLKRYPKLHPEAQESSPPPAPPVGAGVDYEQLHSLIQSAVRSALQDRPANLPGEREEGRRPGAAKIE
jgi:hypothetical protein